MSSMWRVLSLPGPVTSLWHFPVGVVSAQCKRQSSVHYDSVLTWEGVSLKRGFPVDSCPEWTDHSPHVGELHHVRILYLTQGERGLGVIALLPGLIVMGQLPGSKGQRQVITNQIKSLKWL